MNWQLIGSLIGNALEWYDYGIFGALASEVGECFFPSTPSAQLLSTLGAFASGFVARPLGGVLFGYIGDAHGRRPALLGAVLLMALSTLVIGLLPCSSAWGLVSPALLVCLRVAEGLSVGGELVGGILMIVESAPSQDRRSLYGSFMMATASGGVVSGYIVVGLLRLAFEGSSRDAWVTLIWRLPFLLGLAVAAFALWVRRRLHESPEYASQLAEMRLQKPPNPLALAMRNYKMAMAVAVGVVSLSSFGAWLSLWLPTYASSLLPADRSQSRLFPLLLLPIASLMYAVGGHIADHVGALRVMLAAAVSIALASPLLFFLASLGHWLPYLLAFSLWSFLNGCYGGPLCVWLAQSFDLQVRYSAAAIAYNIAQALLGGTSHLILSTILLYYPDQYVLYPALLLSAVALVSAISCGLSGAFLSQLQTPSGGCCQPPCPIEGDVSLVDSSQLLDEPSKID